MSMRTQDQRVCSSTVCMRRKGSVSLTYEWCFVLEPQINNVNQNQEIVVTQESHRCVTNKFYDHDLFAVTGIIPHLLPKTANLRLFIPLSRIMFLNFTF